MKIIKKKRSLERWNKFSLTTGFSGTKRFVIDVDASKSCPETHLQSKENEVCFQSKNAIINIVQIYIYFKFFVQFIDEFQSPLIVC